VLEKGAVHVLNIKRVHSSHVKCIFTGIRSYGL